MRFSSQSKMFQRPHLQSPGILLFDVPVHLVWSHGRVCQVRHNGHWCHHGGDDAGLPATHGPHWKTDLAPVRAWRDVHLLNIHHHLISDKGVSYNIAVGMVKEKKVWWEMSERVRVRGMKLRVEKSFGMESLMRVSISISSCRVRKTWEGEKKWVVASKMLFGGL